MDTPLDFADSLLNDLSSGGDWLSGSAQESIAIVLIGAFSIAVGFVAYKLIKRALNKA